jgi:hypothetical protein
MVGITKNTIASYKLRILSVYIQPKIKVIIDTKGMETK